MGLILDRVRLCEALGVSDSTIGAWEAKGCPVVRRGRGRGMRSLYDLDKVRAWCDRTGYGSSLQAMVASFSRTEPAAPPAVRAPAPAQTSAPQAEARCAFAGRACSRLARLDFEDRADEVRDIRPMSWALSALPSLLRMAGVADEELIKRVNGMMVDRLRAEGMADADLATWQRTLENERIDQECLRERGPARG